jgi:hypothetical protein
VEFLKKVFGGKRYYWDLLERKPGQGSGYGPRLIAALPQQQAVALLIEGAKTHQNPYVRARCVMLLDGYDLGDQQTETIRDVLRSDPSAQVKHAAIGFFGVRAARGRPVKAVIGDLLQILETPHSFSGCSYGDDIMEVAGMNGVPMAASAALKSTVGAKQIIAPCEKTGPGLVAEFKKTLRKAVEDPSGDPAIREDAQLYLKMI